MGTQSQINASGQVPDLNAVYRGSNQPGHIASDNDAPSQTNDNPGYLFGLEKNHPAIQYFETLLSKKERRGKSSFLVFKNNKYQTIQTKDIAYFYIKNDMPTIMTFGKTDYPIMHSLDETNTLVASDKFFRINRQYLLSFSAVREVAHYFSRKLIVKLTMPTEEKLLVGKDKATAFLNWLENR